MTLSEADTRAKLIDPAIHTRGWTEDLIRREETLGAIEVVEGRARRRAKGRTDYTLRVKVNPGTQPVAVAVIEAKAEKLPPGHGLEQGKGYATCDRLNVRFVFSTNGHMFVEFDRATGLTSKARPLSEFPTPAELRKRYGVAVGFKLTDPAAKPLLTPYKGGESRRYYQDAAIRAALEKVARCEKTGEPKRVLLSLATGAGKTFIAVNLLRRIADAGLLRAILLPHRRATGLVFPSATGGRLDAANLRKSILRIGVRAGVTGFCPHDLRRTFASLLAARGVPTTRIRDYLGHASVATTEGYYVARGQIEACDVAKLHLGARPSGTPAAEGTAPDPGRGDSIVESA